MSCVKSSLGGFLVLSVGYKYFHFYKQFVQTSMYCSKVVVTAVDQKLRELRTLKQHYYPEVNGDDYNDANDCSNTIIQDWAQLTRVVMIKWWF